MKINLELESFTGFIEYDGREFIPTKVTRITESKIAARNGLLTEKQLGYCRTMDQAIKRVVAEILGSSNDEVTLSQFLIKYQSIVNQLESLANI